MTSTVTYQTATSSLRLNMKRVVSDIVKVVGREGLVWLLIGVLASILLVAFEFSFIITFQAFLGKYLKIDIGSGRVQMILSNLSHGQILALLMGATLARSGSNLLISHSAHVSLYGISHRLRQFALFDLLFPRNGHHLTSSSINFLLSEAFPKTALLVHYATLIAANLTQVGVIFVGLIYLAWKQSLLGIGACMAMGIFVSRMNRRIRKDSAALPVNQREINKRIELVSRNRLLIRAMRMESFEIKHLLGRANEYANDSVRTSFYGSLVSSSTMFFGVLTLVGIALTWSDEKEAASSVLLPFLYLFLRMIQTLTHTSVCYGALSNHYPSFLEAKKYIASLPNFLNGPIDKVSYLNRLSFPSERKQKRPPPSIELKNVWFRYPNTPSFILEDTSFHVASGSALAICGKSGSGKSTILSLVLGLLEPDKGRVLIANTTASKVLEDQEFVVGYVGAEALVIEGTVRDNILYGLPSALLDDEIMCLVRSCGLADFNDSCDVLDKRISENGEGLSSGQKQRICLARALARKPEILILDEATSNLDSVTELQILDSLRRIKGTCTIIIVTHRKGILEIADTVLSLEEKRVYLSREPTSSF